MQVLRLAPFRLRQSPSERRSVQHEPWAMLLRLFLLPRVRLLVMQVPWQVRQVLLLGLPKRVRLWPE